MPVLRIFISFAALGVLVFLLARTNHTALLQSLSNVSWRSIATALALVQLQIVLSALRWRFTSERLGETIPLGKAIREYYVASLLNQTLPGGVGGDVIRAWRMRRPEEGGWRQAAKAVVFERASGQVAVFIFAAVGLCIYLWTSEKGISATALLYISGIGLLAIIVFLIVRLSRLRNLAKHALAQELTDVFVRRRAWLVQSALSVSVVASYIGVFLVAADATGFGLPLIAALTAIPLCLVAMVIPTGFGGWGTREAAAMALWPMVGASSADGLAASITYGCFSLVGAAPGILFILGSVLAKRPKVV